MDLVKQLIEMTNLTQKDFSEKVGEDPATISRYVNGTRKIPLEKFTLWCDILNVKIQLKQD